MSLLDRMLGRSQEPGDPEPPVVSRPHLRVLRASGQRIDLSARDVGMRITATRQAWQTDAWDYYFRIGELSYALRLLAQQVAKVRFYAGEIRPYPDDPVELTSDEHDLDRKLAEQAVSELARLPLDDSGVDSFIATLTLNLLVAGEAWIHGHVVDGEEKWEVRSISEITAMGDQVMLAELPTSTSLGQRQIKQGEEELLRCWIRHPRYGQLACSPLLSALDIMEGIVLDGREARAAAQSRIAANGILLVPDSLSLVPIRQQVEDVDEEEPSDSFMDDLTEAMVAPIRNEGHAGAIVPLVIRGDAEAMKEVRHLKLDRADPEKLTERQITGVLRLLKSVDIQPEQVEGQGTLSSHWGGWLVEAKDVKQQVDPWSATVGGCLTKAFHRPALLALDYDREQVARVAVCHDVSGLVENPNRGQDARDAHDRLVISDKALRNALGFDDDDQPNEDEIQRRIAAKVGVDQGTAALVLQMARQVQNGQPRVINAQPSELPPGTSPGGNGARPAQPGDTVPEKPMPEQSTTEPNRSMVAAATTALPPGWIVDVDAARQLADIDAALVERIIVAADAAIARAVERAGGRARSIARKDRALTAAIEGVDATLIPSRLGRDTLLAAANLSDLLADAFTRLRGQFFGWLTQAASQVADVVLRLLGLQRRSTEGRRVHDAVLTRLEVHREAAWTALAAALDAAADQAMFRADPPTPERSGRGEEADMLISPSEVTRAVVIAGGGDPEQGDDRGFGTGRVVQDVLTENDGVVLGWEWRYHPERLRNTFVPHARLDGARFTTWTDPQLETDEDSRWIGTHLRPGDHKGCRCGSVVLYARPEPDLDVVSQRLREARESERGRTLTRVAAEDTAAGRVGTSIQREVEVRDRIAADVERLRQHYIEGVRA